MSGTALIDTRVARTALGAAAQRTAELIRTVDDIQLEFFCPPGA